MNGELILNLPRKKYDAIDAVNFSPLQAMADSPAHYRHAISDAQGHDSDAMALGRAAHLATLEPEKFRHEVALWKGGTRRGAKWDTFKAENWEREILKPPAYSLCLALQDAVRRDRDAAKYLEGGKGEVTMLWTHRAPPLGATPAYEIGCKGRIDFLADVGAIVDLKTARSAKPDKFFAACFNLKYHTRAAFYVDGYEAITGRRLPYKIVAVETRSPYVTQVYTIPEHILEQGREEYRALLDRLHFCRTNSVWGTYFDGEMELELPRWATHNVSDEDVTGLDLIIGHQESADGL